VRESRTFTEEELALLRMLVPVLGRLVRERPTPAPPTHLTLSERRILHQVAAGRANAEIAASLCVAESTVRKHLENSYRKLGVSNRMAAVARLRGSDHDGVDLRDRIETFAGTRMGTPAAAG
jgi:DNA-binding CsgD family transcriptional regulator